MSFFRQQNEVDSEGYRKINVPAGEIREGVLTKVKLRGKTILLTRLQNQLCAFSNICPHAAADLSQGRFSRGLIKCPDHSYTFDIRTGRVVWPEDEVCRLKRFPIKESGGLLWVQV